MQKKWNMYILSYFALALIIAPIHILSLDTYYYWDWSRHLALSYFDGAPMVAYFLKIGTLLFGNTLLAISAVGIVTTAITSVILYKTGRLFLEKEASYIAVLLWLFSPLVTLDLLNQITLNTPLTLFWAFTLYFIVRYITLQSSTDLYYIGISIGLMMLSKYSGVVLVLGMSLFLIQTPYRQLFKKPTLYLAGAIAIILFSPVLLWNYQHHWQSFIYQLNSHTLHSEHSAMHNLLQAVSSVFLSSLNFLLIPPLIYGFKPAANKSSAPYFCYIVCISFLVFYFILATHTQIRSFWLEQYLLTGSLLAGYYYQQFKHHRVFHILIICYGVISVAILLNDTTMFNVKPTRKLSYYRWMKTFNATHIPQTDVIITTGWMQARSLFFLKQKPYIYTLCGSNQNQYASWSEAMQQRILNKQITRAIYIDTHDNSACIKQYFDHCEPLMNTPTQDNQTLIFAYQCENKSASRP